MERSVVAARAVITVAAVVVVVAVFAATLCPGIVRPDAAARDPSGKIERSKSGCHGARRAHVQHAFDAEQREQHVERGGHHAHLGGDAS